MTEWIDPRYVELAKAWKQSQEPNSRDPEPRPARGFIITPHPSPES